MTETLEARVVNLMQAFDLGQMTAERQGSIAECVESLVKRGLDDRQIMLVGILSSNLAARSRSFYEKGIDPAKLVDFCQHFNLSLSNHERTSDAVVNLYKEFRQYAKKIGDREMLEQSKSFDTFADSLLRTLEDLGSRANPRKVINSVKEVVAWLKGEKTAQALLIVAKVDERPVEVKAAAPAPAAPKTALAIAAPKAEVSETMLAALGMERSAFAHLARALGTDASEETAHALVYLAEEHGVSDDALVRLVDGGINFSDVPMAFRIVSAISEHTGVEVALRDKVDEQSLPDEVKEDRENSGHIIDTDTLVGFLKHFGLHDDESPGIEERIAQGILDLHQVLGSRRGPIDNEHLQIHGKRTTLNDTLRRAIDVSQDRGKVTMSDLLEHLQP